MPRLFRTDVSSVADLKVYVTDVRTDAHLIVYETTDAWAATEAPIWCYTDIQSEADKSIYFVDSRFDADLVIFRTDIQSDAGWVDSAKSDLL